MESQGVISSPTNVLVFICNFRRETADMLLPLLAVAPRVLHVFFSVSDDFRLDLYPPLGESRAELGQFRCSPAFQKCFGCTSRSA